MAAQDIARIASIQAEIAAIQGVWADSDEQEQAFFALELSDLHAEIASIRAAAEQAAARKTWTRSVARTVKAVNALSKASDLNSDACHTEAGRIQRSVDRAESRAFAAGVDVSSAAAELRASVAPAREAAGRWFTARLDAQCAEAAKLAQRPLTHAEQQHHADLRAAFR